MAKKILANKKIVLEILATLIGYFLMLYLFLKYWNAGKMADFLLGFGIISDVLFCVLATLKFVFPVAPGQVFSMTGVVLFGQQKSFLYMLFAMTLGTYLVLKLTQRYGQPFVRKSLGKKKFERINNLSGDKTLFTFFVLNLLPGFPKDLLPFAAGLTQIPIWKLMLVFISGKIPFYYMYSKVGSSFLVLDFKAMFFWFGGLFIFAGILFLVKKLVLPKPIF